MTNKKLGSQTVCLSHPPVILGSGNAVGKKEGEGPLASTFDYIAPDDTYGESTWEKSESAMQKKALAIALNKTGLAASNLDWLFAGDLLNQCISSSTPPGSRRSPSSACTEPAPPLRKVCF